MEEEEWHILVYLIWLSSVGCHNKC